ncbi:MAG: GNAT family N-acetyltransferase [Promethearchaeota archaeon]
MKKIETERLIIRNFRSEDEEELYQAVQTYKATEYAQMEERDTGNKWPDERDQYKGIVEWFSKGDEFLAVILKNKTQLIGFINKSKTDDRIYNFGYVFHSAYSGKGYAYESGKAVINHIFENLSADIIKTGTPEENIPSQKLLIRLGFKSIGKGEFSLKKGDWMKLED